MTRIPYTKTIKTFDEQIEILKSRGLQFNDEMQAKQLLQNISYYRMSGYWYPLLADKQNHVFKSGALFEQAYSISSIKPNTISSLKVTKIRNSVSLYGIVIRHSP